MEVIAFILFVLWVAGKINEIYEKGQRQQAVQIRARRTIEAERKRNSKDWRR